MLAEKFRSLCTIGSREVDDWWVRFTDADGLYRWLNPQSGSWVGEPNQITMPGFKTRDAAQHGLRMAPLPPAELWLDICEPQWTKDPPREQGEYWHWNGDRNSEPLPMFVLFSGTSGKCFVSSGQLGIDRAIDCDEYGGWWKKLDRPELPDGAA